MADVTVGFDHYRSGSLPDICVFTGRPTTDRMVLRARIVERDAATKQPGPIVGYLSQLRVMEDPRKPRDILLGRLPVDADHLRARKRREQALRIGGWVSLLVLVVAAVSAQVWSPLLAVASIAALVVVLLGRMELRRNVPTPTLIGAGTRVHLANVHQKFVDALFVPPPGGRAAP